MIPNWLAEYLRLNLVLAAVAAAAWLIDRSIFGARRRLRIVYGLVLVGMASVFLVGATGDTTFTIASHRVWQSFGTGRIGEAPALVAQTAPVVVGRDWVSVGVKMFLALAAAIWVGHAVRLSRCWRRTHFYRRYGKIEIRFSDEEPVPFSFYWPGRRAVSLPTYLLENRTDMRIALRHEFEHHRRGDTLLAPWLFAIRLGFAVNPAASYVLKKITEWQELAVDEVLVRGKRIRVAAYGRCLITIAARARTERAGGLACSALSPSAQFLKRRIETMTEKNVRKNRWSAAVGIGLVFSLLATALVASRVGAVESSVSRAQADSLVENAKRNLTGEPFPFVMNERVLAELNQFLSPAGKKFIKRARARYEKHREIFAQQLARHHLPQPLLAIAMVESGFRNALPAENPVGAAGIWQIMAETAHNYALNVSSPGTKSDERLDVRLSTDAAFRYLSALRLRFHQGVETDPTAWPLAILAYNSGEYKVQDGINDLNTRDAWILVDKGYQNDRGYLPRVMAAAILWENPQLFN